MSEKRPEKAPKSRRICAVCTNTPKRSTGRIMGYVAQNLIPRAPIYIPNPTAKNKAHNEKKGPGEEGIQEDAETLLHCTPATLHASRLARSHDPMIPLLLPTMVPCAITYDPMIPKPFPTMVMCNTCVIICNTSVHYLGYLTSKYEHKICVWAALSQLMFPGVRYGWYERKWVNSTRIFPMQSQRTQNTMEKGYRMKEASAQVRHATNDFCIAPRLAESSAHSMDGLITMAGLMKDPSAQVQHATNDFCIAPRLVESGAHSMDSLITIDGLMKEPCAQVQNTQQTTFV